MMVRNGWVYWPLEAELTPAAMHHVEAALMDYANPNRGHGWDALQPKEVRDELLTLANQIRACLQHIEAELRSPPAPTLEELLR